MRPYTCPTCGQMVFFDDTACTACDTDLGFRPESREVSAVGSRDRRCANHDEIGCSWLVAEADEELCRSCRLTRTRPPAGDAAMTLAWAEAEQAKRMLLWQALGLGLDIEGATFDLKSGDVEPVITGHADGVITIDVREADDVVRTRMRERMGEPYRTMLGHFRHEIGHYLWMTLVDGTDHLAGFREVFGDETTDYAEALEAHYGSPDPEGWQDGYVSVYATAHPWEDFAETLAHYLHIRDTLETAGSFGLSVDGAHEALQPAGDVPTSRAAVDRMAIEDLVERWLPLTYALNAVNRSMGRPPLYPFVLAPAVIAKLGWVHELVTDTS
ncbi:putative zinc-binding metallopeptidase [Euzebya sp.]|uniref:zinc-binding metallopeptidase family protein n=1 Tax=Euzebya sp. TaxID=1971409 RepID=UPI0035199FEE